jgi:hypothetical protein
MPVGLCVAGLGLLTIGRPAKRGDPEGRTRGYVENYRVVSWTLSPMTDYTYNQCGGDAMGEKSHKYVLICYVTHAKILHSSRLVVGPFGAPGVRQHEQLVVMVRK